MPSTPTTKSQVQAYRFVLRRMESALVRKDPVMLHDPMRSHKRSTIVGAIVGVVGLVVFLLIGVLKPAPTVPNSGIVIAQQSGAVYVVSQSPKELIPVFNVASGRLLLAVVASRNGQQGSTGGQPQSAPQVVNPVTVDDSELDGMPVGNIEGIPDGPTVLPKPAQPATTWAVCDNILRDNNALDQTGHRAPQTTVVVGEPNIGSTLNPGQALLVSSDGGTTLYLVYGLAANANEPNDSAVRAQIDANDPAVLHALNISSRNSYRVVSPAVLNAIPSVSEIQNPAAGLDTQAAPVAKLATAGLHMGESFGVKQVGQPEQYYMVVPGGMEPVSQTTAQIAINENSVGQTEVPAVQPDATDGVPTVQYGDPGDLQVNVTKYPGVRPTVISADTKPVMCLGWNADYADPQQPLAKTRVTVGLKLAVPNDPTSPNGQMSMAQIGQAGSVGKINSFFMNPSLGGVAVRAATSAGDFDSGQIYVIDPRGVAYSVPDTYTAQVLGVADGSGNGDLPPGPQSIIALLPLGGQPLDMQAVQHAYPGGMNVPPGAGQYLQPNQGGGGN